MYREEEEEEERQRRTKTLRKTEKRSIDEVLSSSNPRNRTLKSPIVTQLPPPVPTGNPENSGKRRTTRRTTIRLAQDNANGKSSFTIISSLSSIRLRRSPTSISRNSKQNSLSYSIFHSPCRNYDLRRSDKFNNNNSTNHTPYFRMNEVSSFSSQYLVSNHSISNFFFFCTDLSQ